MRADNVPAHGESAPGKERMSGCWGRGMDVFVRMNNKQFSRESSAWSQEEFAFKSC